MITVGAYLILKDVRSKRVTYFGNLSTLERTHNFKIFQPSSGILIFKLVMIILLYMVATNSIQAREISPISDTDYMLVLDMSSSMTTEDILPNRFDAARNLALDWLSIVPNTTQVGFLGFSQTIDVEIDTTFNKAPIRQTIETIQVDYSKPGTDLDNAINFALESFNDSIQKKTILLFTDGTEPVLNRTIDKANDNAISLIIFGMGTNESGIEFNAEDEDIPDEFFSDYQGLAFNFTLLEDIANRTNGKAYQITSADQLQQNFAEATNEEIAVPINVAYYIIIIIAFISILELIMYAYLGAL